MQFFESADAGKTAQNLLLEGFPACKILLCNICDRGKWIQADHPFDLTSKVLLLCHEEIHALFEVISGETGHDLAI